MPIVDKPRFPRLEKRDVDEMVRMQRLRVRYPPPPYRRDRDGGWNPGDYIPTWLMKQTTEKLRELCKKHELESEGERWKLIRRMYLEWWNRRQNAAIRQKKTTSSIARFPRTNRFPRLK